ncbi:hypothetical protein [Epilithonimonas arachidiradicis]|uniref:Uncharacterized protein n=1 Tax=Epilithonimonas arachidiradicis TaxID=1617282 RepID=A0A420CPK6_9FLAO|nr:hypothetical protein [Epilithonimonas arachidiradicis]RKE80331.1 hypothetical protein BXY58_2849 [Epilithonimonas arachidiradicis]GGG64401.1 hypothetical protein GCM10007332_28510 [Epilithonimonas arachidiradicis]
MKNLVLLIFLLVSVKNFAQDYSLNKIAKIPDSIANFSELRIYLKPALTNSWQIFRMYQEKENTTWKIELIKKSPDSIKQMEELNSQTNLDVVWLKILQSDILYLPKWESIQYKFKKSKTIELEEGKFIDNYSSVAIMDGIGYEVMIKNNKEFNKILYSNPEGYLKHFENIDELIAFKNLLDTIRNEFGIWKTNNK